MSSAANSEAPTESVKPDSATSVPSWQVVCENSPERCWRIREVVFCDEQGFPLQDEFDDKETTSDHLLLLDTSSSPPRPAGTIRYWPNLPIGKLGRLAVLKEYRGTGAGRVLVQAFEQHVRQRKGKGGQFALDNGLSSVKILCSSQHQVESFYARLGYVREGEPYDEDGWPHVAMYKTIDLDSQ